MAKCKYSSTYSYTWHEVEASDGPHASVALHPGKESLYPLDRRLGRNDLSLIIWHQLSTLTNRTDIHDKIRKLKAGNN
jgi:hypothetical protein